MINGAQIKKSDAPISRIMAISGLRTTIPVEMVEWIKKTDTSTRIRINTAGVREVKRSAEVAGTLSGASKMVGAGSAVLILILVLVSVFLIHSTISTGIVVRKPEIAIMRLMGASDFFIWAPAHQKPDL